MKTFIGPQLRRLRRERGETQAQMGRALGISTSYVNLLEKNERSVSVPVLLRLLEAYGVDWRDFADDDGAAVLADMRAALQDPLFDATRPDLAQMRAARVHSPELVSSFLTLHAAYLAVTENLLSGAGQDATTELLAASPEASVHAFFRASGNHFENLENAAERFWGDAEVPADERYTWVKRDLRERLGLRVRLVPADSLHDTLRRYDADEGEVLLSEALDQPNRIFQLVHVAGLVAHGDLLDMLVAQSGIRDSHGVARCRVELANYFAAAVLMPYRHFLNEARASKFDFDHLATRFGVSFEQACHRAVTLGREGAAGVPFFFLRIDRAGNVTKRFNTTGFHLAEHGGACPRLEVHGCFRTPGRIVSQLVEMPDASQLFVFARTVDRPSSTRHSQDMRQAVAMGCSLEHAGAIGYADELSLSSAMVTEIGINCRVCPRLRCDQRAQHPILPTAPVDAFRRGTTRYDS
ncbi:MAG: short-chain fatty acyl-CoA regulator family protein [Pseudomonadota bacterium]